MDELDVDADQDFLMSKTADGDFDYEKIEAKVKNALDIIKKVR